MGTSRITIPGTEGAGQSRATALTHKDPTVHQCPSKEELPRLMNPASFAALVV